jgi:tetratricopeptide (TPR) repeat protein
MYLGRALILGCAMLVGGCAPLAAEHHADAAFRQALTAHIRGDEPAAEAYYHQIITLGFNWSAVWNNLAVIEAHRREYIASRKLLARAVAAGPRDVVALTNYGVMSYYLSDLKEARRALVDAKRLREDNLNLIPSVGDNHYRYDHYVRVTEPLLETGAKFLRRIDQSELGRPVPAEDGVRVAAALTVHHL